MAKLALAAEDTATPAAMQMKQPTMETLVRALALRLPSVASNCADLLGRFHAKRPRFLGRAEVRGYAKFASLRTAARFSSRGATRPCSSAT